MLLVYRTSTGEVIDNAGTNSLFPDGVPDEFAYANTDAAGIPREELSLLRLNDHNPLVVDVLHLGCTVVGGEVVLASPEAPVADPEPEVAPKPTLESVEAQIDVLLDLLRELKEEASDA